MSDTTRRFKHSFLKWPGGKFRILDKLIPLLPTGDRFIEPFAGSCVVSLNTNYPKYILNDVNSLLMGCLSHVLEGYLGGESLGDLFTEENNTKIGYERIRKRFNSGGAGCCESAKMFVYLNRHCFNGLWRCNSRGHFNVPFGKYKRVNAPIREIEYFCSKFSGLAILRTMHFADIMVNAIRGDVIYCDPPYVPLSPTANFTKYTSSGFGKAQHENLVRCAKDATRVGAVVLISNHDTEFTRELYKEAYIVSYDVNRTISASKKGRKKVRELIAIY